MAGEIYLSNVAGSFDYQTLLDAYYQSQMQPVYYLKNQEAELSNKISAVTDFSSKISNIYSAFNDLTSTTILDQKTVFSSNESVLTANVTDPADALTGSVSVTVNQLAQNDVWFSQTSVSDLTSAVATTSGTIQISYGGNVVATIDYDTDTTDTTNPSTLQEIANAINNAQDKVSASVVYDGTGYRLLLSGADTGASNTVSITEIGGGDLLDQLQIGDNYTASHVQTAQDASVSVYGTELTSSTNTFDNAIPGIQFTVKDVGSATISVENDYQPFKDALNKFIDAYNSLVDFVQKEEGKDGRLSGETMLQSVRSGLLSRMEPLVNLGVLDFDKDTGHAILDSSKLDNLLNSSPDTVEQAVSDLKTSMYDYLLYLQDPTGPIEALEDSLNNQKNNLEEQIEDMQKVIKDQVEIFRQQLIQVQLLQEEMNSVKARLTSTFGEATLIPSS